VRPPSSPHRATALVAPAPGFVGDRGPNQAGDGDEARGPPAEPANRQRDAVADQHVEVGGLGSHPLRHPARGLELDQRLLRQQPLELVCRRLNAQRRPNPVAKAQLTVWAELNLGWANGDHGLHTDRVASHTANLTPPVNTLPGRSVEPLCSAGAVRDGDGTRLGEKGLASFRRLNDVELDRLDDEKLIEYIREARSEGELKTMNEAIQIFAYRHRRNVLNRVRKDLRDRPDSDIEATTDLIIGGAMFASFRGESVGQFRSLLNTIYQRRIADYWRTTHGTVRYTEVADEHEDDEGIRGAILTADEELSLIWGADLVARALEPLSPAHESVVDHRLFQGYSSHETADLVNNHFGDELDTPMTATNVDQIVSRFRRGLNDLLEEANRDVPPSQNADDG
jgi:DNA-directed RNA polymerase specialized sigma24 family protein